MITFKTFLNESTDLRLSPEDAAHVIASSCKPFLKATGIKYDGTNRKKDRIKSS